jgi:DNA-binding NarL/FixJ family response regulator
MERLRRVLIANADENGRLKVRAAAKAAGLRICGYAKTAEDAVAKARRTQPDICLLDLDLPGGGIRAAGEIVDERSDVAVVVLSNFESAGASWMATVPAEAAASNGLRDRLAQVRE